MHTFVDTGPGVPAFLAKLWRLVEDPATDNLITWSPDGKSFIIQNQAQFARELLPLNYKHNNMASFIRQLNMYGFHKITSIDNGGLKFDRDDMEFSHSFFQRGHPYLVDHIKRKIAHPKATEEKGTLKPETVSKVLTEVKMMRGRQDTLDSRFSAMKQENEALWREIALLRQKHMKQQHIVNKLISFLVTIVQPQRTGLNSSMGGKRRFQLMINEAPQSQKIAKTTHSISDDSPIVDELSEEFLDEECDSNSDLNNLSPIESENIMNNPINDKSNESLIDAIQNQMPDDYAPFITHPSSERIIEETESMDSDMNDQHNITIMNSLEDDFNAYDETDNILTTPLVKKELERNKKQLQQQILEHQKQQQDEIDRQFELDKQERLLLEERNQKQRTTKSNKSSSKSLLKINKHHHGRKHNSKTKHNIQNENKVIQNDNNGNSSGIEQNEIQVKKPTRPISIKKEKLPTYTNQEDFMNAEMPSDIFDENTLESPTDSSPLIGGIRLEGAGVNQKNSTDKNIDEGTSSGDNQANDKNMWALSAMPKGVNEELLRFNSVADFDQHLENFQGELDSLKDLLRGDGISVDANTLLGLFADSDILAPYGLTMLERKDGEPFNNSLGSELMTYQPSINCDLSELLDDDNVANESNTDSINNNTQHNLNLTLNTPQYEKEFQSYLTNSNK